MKMYKGEEASAQAVMRTVIQVLRCSGVTRLPIDLFALMEPVPNLRKCSYTRFAAHNRMSIWETRELLGSNYGTYVSLPAKNRHMIYYNDTAQNQGLLRFTLAHELAHFYLRHSEKMRGERASYASLEWEANFFARNLLSPIPLVRKMMHGDPANGDNIPMLTQCFHISYAAARNRLSSYQSDAGVLERTGEDLAFFDRFALYQSDVLYSTGITAR